MVSRTLSVLATLIPAIAFANAVAEENPEIQQAELETWSDEQLCRARDIPGALDELERREVFDRRELRAIRRDEVRKGISEDALRCMAGSPETILPDVTTVEDDAVDAFVYPPGAFGSLVVFIRREGDSSTVIADTVAGFSNVLASGIAGAGLPDERFCSDGPATAMRRPRGNACFPGTAAYSQHDQMVRAQRPPTTWQPLHPLTLPSQ